MANGMRSAASLGARFVAAAALAALVSGCIATYTVRQRPVRGDEPAVLAGKEALVFGRILIYRNGGRYPPANGPQPEIYLTPPDYRRSDGLVIEPPVDIDSDGYFQMIAPLGRYGLVVHWSPHGPTPWRHRYQWLIIDPAVTLNLTAARCIAYVGTLRINLASGRERDLRRWPLNYRLLERQVTDDYSRARARLVAQSPQNSALPMATSLFRLAAGRKPSVEFHAPSMFGF